MGKASRKTSVTSLINSRLQRPAIVSAVAWEDAGVEARKCLIDLAARLGMDSSNSSMPPSSDGPSSSSGSTGDEKSSKAKKKSGAQPGHPRHERPLIPTDECDDVHIIRPKTCNGCGTSLTKVPDDPAPQRHQVVDLPKISPQTIEYQQQRLKCPCCGQTTLAKLPAGVPPGQFGSGVVTAVTMLGGLCRLSHRLTVTVLENLFQLKLSTGMITKLRSIGQRALEPAHEEIAGAVRNSKIVHADETSWYEGSEKAWMWTAVASNATLFLIQGSRSSAAARELLGEDFSGTIITDRYASYNWIDDERRQFCWAHLLRDFQAMIDVGGLAAEVGRVAKSAGQKLIHKWKELQRGKIKRSTFEKHDRVLSTEISTALMDGLTCDHAKTEGVCCELFKHFDCLWTFTKVDGIEPTNNIAEHSVRHGVIWRKLSQGTASSQGSRYVETILSVLATCQQNKINAFDFVRKSIEANLKKSPTPKLLPKTP